MKKFTVILVFISFLISLMTYCQKPRARDLGIPFVGVTGKFNAITDVKGVEVGYSTITGLQKHTFYSALLVGSLSYQQNYWLNLHADIGLGGGYNTYKGFVIDSNINLGAGFRF